jgi:pimeloyl-ACP methyl ester carboxylesterase
MKMDDENMKLYYEEIGEGLPLVFLHGFPLNHTTWLPAAKILKTRAHCILPDLRGLGKSSVTGTETTILQMAKDIIRLVDMLKIQKAVFIGHSMGGYIAMQLAHSFPERVIGLGLVATRPDKDSPEKASARMQSRDEVLRNGSGVVADSMASRLTDDPDTLSELLNIIRNTHPHGVAMSQFAMVHRNDATQWLSSFDFPVAVVAGALDKSIPEEVLISMSQQIRGAKYYSSPTGTHMVPLEEPDLLARALTETFLSPK